ncbi:MAG: winged helix DNA-binding domain-containing protein [Armatimonadetes bacterium]|nr:winged helix DNA-binding domain-containing protein [Armatimonadota bacterium]
MELQKLRAWWAHKQALDGSLMGSPPETVLEKTGWSRSVGGANPYLALWARCGCSREEVDRSVAALRLHELPSARGCTYVLPSSHFAIGLSAGQGFGEEAAIGTAVRHLGATMEELQALQASVLGALKDGPLDPVGLKARLGDQVRNFGPEGKKRGITTSLPLALGKLQASGEIRRVPLTGRIDGQRYAYALWASGPRPSLDGRPDALKRLATEYFEWTGPARFKEFQWFSGLGVQASKDAVAGLDLVDVGDGLLLHRHDLKAFQGFEAPQAPTCVFVGPIDNVSHLRAGLADLIDPADGDLAVMGAKSSEKLSSVTELSNHAIYDRGRLIGVWDFDPSSQELVYAAWSGDRDFVAHRAQETRAFVAGQIGDARTFSLDSPVSRKHRIEGIKALRAELTPS